MPAEIKEISGQFADIMVVTELRGAYPNVPIAADVDYAALVAGDPDPSFLTIPIGKANVTSGNKRYYDDAWLQELERQTLANKPIGLMGHLSEAERSTAFPMEAVHWVGAVREQGSDVLWGKAYIVPGEARDRIRRYKAQGKSIATSIDAHADGLWDESLKAYRMDAKTLRLSQIDIAPADRAGVGVLARVPMLTSEMQIQEAAIPGRLAGLLNRKIDEMTDDANPRAGFVSRLATEGGIDESTVNQILSGSISCPPLRRLRGFSRVLNISFDAIRAAAKADGCEYAAQEIRQENDMDKLTVINELTAEDARLLPANVRAAIVATVPTPAEVATVTSIREALSLDDKADVVGAIADMKRVQAEQAKQAVSNRIKELIEDKETGIKLESVRGDVRELVDARDPQTIAEAEAAYAAVLEMGIVKTMLASRVTETMGPPQRTPVQSKAGTNRYFKIPTPE